VQAQPVTAPKRRFFIPVYRAYVHFLVRRILRFAELVQELGAFALITLGTIGSKLHVARGLIQPILARQIHRSGIRLLPMISLIGLALGLVIIGQTVFLLSKVGAQNYVGTIMTTVVIRELGPLVTALVALARIGTANVIELGTSRAMGEVEALEALGIDPVHFLVVPRVIGLALSIFSLSVYLVLVCIFSGYLFIFLQDIALGPREYLDQIAAAVRWEDFILLALKASLFGVAIALITCFQGLAHPLRLEEVSAATTRAVGQSIVACILLDALFIVVYLLI